MDIPKCIEHAKSKIEETLIPFVRIKAEKGLTTQFDSKFGGTPYFPLGMEYPRDTNGFPMKLLAQINFEQVPSIPDYPTSGILQFYLSVRHDSYGLDFGDEGEQKNFRVLYFENITRDEDKLLTDFEFTKVTPGKDVFPLLCGSEAKLSFSVDEEFMNLGDFRMKDAIGIDEDKWDSDLEDYYEASTEAATGHKIGGYPWFTQWDPRGVIKGFSNYKQLLLQIDTDDDIDCHWGDGGVGNFFIASNDLREKNFSKVLYTYDCN